MKASFRRPFTPSSKAKFLFPLKMGIETFLYFFSYFLNMKLDEVLDKMEERFKQLLDDELFSELKEYIKQLREGNDVTDTIIDMDSGLYGRVPGETISELREWEKAIVWVTKSWDKMAMFLGCPDKAEIVKNNCKKAYDRLFGAS